MGALRTALFVTDSRSSFRELAEVARLLQASGSWSAVICIVCGGVAAEEDLSAQRTAGIACVDMVRAIEERPQVRVARRRTRLRMLLRPLARLVRLFVRGARRLVRSVRRRVSLPDFAWRSTRQILQLRRSRLLMRRVSPDLVVLSEENVEGVSAPIVRAAHEASAVVAILPNTLATAAEPAQTYSSNPDHALRGLSNRIVARLYPRWVHVHEGRALLRLPAAGVLAAEWLDLAPPLPWQINSGAADAILIESPATWRYFARAGLPPEKLHLTGTLSTDRLAQGVADAQDRRARLCERLGLEPGRALILCALPPNQLDVRAHVCDFASYEGLLRFWVDTLAGAGDCNLVLSLHPRSRVDPVRFLEGPTVRIADAPVIELIPLCDLFVASVSATIRWAIACGKPVLNYDVYRYRYDDYRGVEGVVTLEDREAFAHEARRMLSEPEHLADLARRQLEAAPDWGRLDGQAGTRILALFEEMTRGGGQGAALPRSRVDPLGRARRAPLA